MRQLAVALVLAIIASAASAGGPELVPPRVVEDDCALCESPVITTLAQRQLNHYLYVTYPNYVATLAERIRMAEATIDVLTARINAYRPFRSFEEYSPTWTAQQNTRLALLATQQDLAALRRIEAELPFYHRENVARLKAAMR